MIARDDRDSYRVVIAWASSGAYPKNPFYGLSATDLEVGRHTSAEVPLAQFSDDGLPYEFYADASVESAERAQQSLMVEAGGGRSFSPEEWLATLQVSPSSIEDCKRRISEQSKVICQALRSAIARIEAMRTF